MKLPDTTICVSASDLHDFLLILVTDVAGCQLSPCCMEHGVLCILEGYISDAAAYNHKLRERLLADENIGLDNTIVIV